MKLSVLLLSVSVLGAVGGAWLIGRWAVGCVIVASSVLLGVFALLRDDAKPKLAVVPEDGSEEALFRRRVAEAQAKRAS